MKLVSRFRETGSVEDLQRPGRPSKTAEMADQVAAVVEEKDGKTSVREVSSLLSIPKSSVHLILSAHLHLRPYHFQVVPILTDVHKEKRVKFASDMTARIQNTPELLNSILWTDEAAFHLNGLVSNHYMRIWSKDNPHAVMENTATSPKVTV
jgi:hypothetical protein